MAQTKVILFQENDGSIPVMDWLASISRKARAKCLARLERLSELGHELRRPEADLLRDGIYELRASLQGQNYRMLYFFHGRAVAVVSHGLVKERVVPPREIELAAARKRQFEKDPEKHTYADQLSDG